MIIMVIKKVKSLKELWKNLDDIIELEENLIKIYIDMVNKILY